MKPNAKLRILVVGAVFLLSTRALHNMGTTLSEEYGLMPPNEDAAGGYGIRRKSARGKTAPKPVTTLVHYDPYFMGGFRNQHMRFVAFVAAAVKSNISQILLPSLRWGDHYNKGAGSAPHELIFDVEYWNSRAEDVGLPLLVDYDPNVLEGVIDNSLNGSAPVVPCFNVTSGLYSGMDEALLRNPKTNLRRMSTWNMIGQGEAYAHCLPSEGNSPENITETARRDQSSNKVYRFTHLRPHGGLAGGSGRLWWEYEGLQKGRQKASEPSIVDGEAVMVHPDHVHVEKSVYELLRPSQSLRKATDDAINSISLKNSTVQSEPRLLALHPRVEQEMLTHRCSKFMEGNLSKVFERIETYEPFIARNRGTGYRFDLVFIAISKEQIEKQFPRDNHLGRLANGNRDAIFHARSHGLFGTGVPMFESGTGTAAKVQFPRTTESTSNLQFVKGAHNQMIPVRSKNESSFVTASELGSTELIASMINFFTAVQAEIFVGVKGSTYSTDVFSVRYYQHKESGGGDNYIMTPEGIQRLYGPPAPHACS